MRSIRRIPFVLVLAVFWLAVSVVRAQVSGGADVNVSRMANYQNECAIAKNPSNKLQLFAACNNATGGLFAARSTDGGATWTFPDADKTIADGDANQGAAACCDPSLAWDTFGNLYLTYIDSGLTNIVTILSTDGGQTWSDLASFGPASVDQPTVTAAETSDPAAPVAVWIVWNQSGQMRARGAPVTGAGVGSVGAFIAMQTITGTANCSFGDVAIAPSGAVVQACESLTGTGDSPETIRVNTKADGLGPGAFAAVVAATTTNVGGFDTIPAQSSRTIDAEAGLAFDAFAASPHAGRLYLVYTDETPDESNDTTILLRFSDDNGAHWSPSIRVDDDPAARSQFLPRIAVNRLSGNVGVCWHDARNSATNDAMEEFCTIATPAAASPAFMANAQVGDALSTGTGSSPPVAGQSDIQFGDYSGMAYHQGLVHPIWADVSNSTGDNPDGTTRYDAYTDSVTGGAAANEGDPHITTVDGIHYDFQSAGEFVVLRDGEMEIQTRQTPVPTASAVANAYTGLTTCVSLNTAVAARVGSHRVTFEPNLSGQPDPSGLQLRVDGNAATIPAGGIDLGSGGRVASSPGGGIEIEFPNDTTLVATPGWWSSQGLWFMNVDVFHTPALEGIMGVRAPGSWLPALSDGASLGARPASLHDRYVDLNEKFADSWRVTDKTSLFDYAPGTTTATFRVAGWPPENPPCVIPHTTPAKPVSAAIARKLCRGVRGKNRNSDCVFDVRVTGNRGFVKTYLLSQRIQTGSTTTTVSADPGPSRPEQPVTFTATVSRNLRVSGRGRRRFVPAGTVQFTVDGERAGRALRLDSRGQARWSTSRLPAGKHRVSASYTPQKSTAFLASRGEQLHVVKEGRP